MLFRLEYEPEWGNSGDVRFNISIPAEFNIRLETSAGDLEIDGNVVGTVKGSTSGWQYQNSVGDGIGGYDNFRRRYLDRGYQR